MKSIPVIILLFLGIPYLCSAQESPKTPDWATTIKYVEKSINELTWKQSTSNENKTSHIEYRFRSPGNKTLAPKNAYQIERKSSTKTGLGNTYTYDFKLYNIKSVKVESDNTYGYALWIRFGNEKVVDRTKHDRTNNKHSSSKTSIIQLFSSDKDQLRKLKNAIERAAIIARIEARDILEKEKEPESDPFDY